jgi:hypothetical protein
MSKTVLVSRLPFRRALLILRSESGDGWTLDGNKLPWIGSAPLKSQGMSGFLFVVGNYAFSVATLKGGAT